MKRRIEVELDLKDERVWTARGNIVNTLIKGIQDIVHKLSDELSELGHETINASEIGTAFANYMYNFTEFIIIDGLQDHDVDESIIDIIEELGGGKIGEDGKTITEEKK